MNDKDKIILDLCGGSGAWSKPYKDSGYTIINVTLPEYDVRLYKPPENVYGILAAPPCTMFSFARTKAKKMRDLKGGMKLVIACLKIIWECQYEPINNIAKKTRLNFWALENPNGFLKYFLGRPVLEFHPYEYGDMYKKKTNIWGWFNAPPKIITNKLNLPKFGGDKDIKFRFDRNLKSITPQGFAGAFYEANK